MLTTGYYVFQWTCNVMLIGIIGSLVFNDEINQLGDYIISLRKKSEVR